jgi:hypothetical protein
MRTVGCMGKGMRDEGEGMKPHSLL